MLKHFLNSLNGKLLLVGSTLYIAFTAVSWFTDKQLIIFGTIPYLFFNIWPWISNRRGSILFLSWFFRNLRPIELISFDGTRYYTLAKYDSYNKMSAPVYFGSNIGNVILLEDGTTDPSGGSRYIKYWLPLNKSDRTLHILKYDLNIT